MIRTATTDDIKEIQRIYAYARQFMAETGNPAQWGSSYPPEELVKEDIKKGRLYVAAENGQLHGVFMFAVGDDPVYMQIEDGEWLADTEYGVIHRIAGDGQIHGLLRQAVRYCEQKISHLRMDTHRDNKIMQHALQKNGFIRCGIIHIEDGSERIAFERV